LLHGSDTVGAEETSIRVLSMMATTVIKEKDTVMFRTENGNDIGAIFHLQDHVVVRPITLCVDTTFEFKNKR
jgi:hypothetical protein